MFHRQFIKKKGKIKGGKGSVIVALSCYVSKGQLKVAKKINLSHAALHEFFLSMTWRENATQTEPDMLTITNTSI